MVQKLNTVDVIITDERLKIPGSLPKVATQGSAGYDLRACVDDETIIYPGKTLTVSTGISIHIKNPSYAAIIVPRSGLGTQGIILGNSVGLIDSDYTGTLKVNLWNRSEEAYSIMPLERVAQLVFLPIALPELNFVLEFENVHSRGSNGFGSTGKL